MLYIKTKKNNTQKNNFKIIISLKVSKRAVVRNKIRRRIREILRDLDLEQGYDIVVITTKDIIGKSFEDIKHRIIKIINDRRII